MKIEGRNDLRGQFGGRGLIGILCSLVGAGFPVIGWHRGYRWPAMDVDRVRTSLFYPPWPSPLVSSLSSFLSSPPVSLRGLQPCRRGRLGVSSGACLPGRLHWMVPACGQACGYVHGCCAMPCHRHGYGVAWSGYVDVVVDAWGGDGGGGKEEVTMWQHLSHGYRIWNVTGHGSHRWVI